MRPDRRRLTCSTMLLAVARGLATLPAGAQMATRMERGSDDIAVVGHLPMGARLTVTDMDVEQELSRPMEGFSGWNGEDWGQPNVSSVQEWDRGPVQHRLIGDG